MTPTLSFVIILPLTPALSFCHPSASPDFLSRVAASVNCMWFSLGRTTYVVAGESGEAGNPGTLGMTKRREQVSGERR
jgi:hypothetical protein